MTKIVRGLTPSSLMEQINEGAPPLVIDVRSKREFDAGHVPGARHIPFWRMAATAQTLASHKDRSVVLYCGHGPRAYIAGAALRRAGFRDVKYLTGHMKQWRDLNFPLEGRE